MILMGFAVGTYMSSQAIGEVARILYDQRINDVGLASTGSSGVLRRISSRNVSVHSTPKVFLSMTLKRILAIAGSDSSGGAYVTFFS